MLSMNIASLRWKVLVAMTLVVCITLPHTILSEQDKTKQVSEIPPAQAPVYLLSGMKGSQITVIVKPVGNKKKRTQDVFKPIPWDKKLNELGVPKTVTKKLQKLEGIAFYGEPRFKLGVRSVLSKAECDTFYATILKIAIAHPHPNPRLPPSKLHQDGNKWTLITGESNFVEPKVDAFTLPPGTNQLPNIYTNLFDGAGKVMPNTLPSTKLDPYHLHDGAPVVTEINQTSPTDDLLTIFQTVVTESKTALNPPAGEQEIDFRA